MVYTYKESETYGEYNIYLTLSEYFTYNNQIIDCECVEEIVEERIDIKTSRSFSLYENVNERFEGKDVTSYEYGTIDEHLNSEYLKSIIQNTDFKSEIFKLDSGVCYRIDVFEDTPNTTDTWAIININDDEAWGGDGTPDVFIEDWCGKRTSEKYIRLKDINPYSLTYGEIIEQLKCY